MVVSPRAENGNDHVGTDNLTIRDRSGNQIIRVVTGFTGIGQALAAMPTNSDCREFPVPAADLPGALVAMAVCLVSVRMEYFQFAKLTFHNTKWLFLAATLAVRIPDRAIRKKDRPASGLMILCTLGCGRGGDAVFAEYRLLPKQLKNGHDFIA
jgi:hypothetical protein